MSLTSSTMQLIPPEPAQKRGSQRAFPQPHPGYQGFSVPPGTLQHQRQPQQEHSQQQLPQQPQWNMQQQPPQLALQQQIWRQDMCQQPQMYQQKQQLPRQLEQQVANPVQTPTTLQKGTPQQPVSTGLFLPFQLPQRPVLSSHGLYMCLAVSLVVAIAMVISVGFLVIQRRIADTVVRKD